MNPRPFRQVAGMVADLLRVSAGGPAALGEKAQHVVAALRRTVVPQAFHD